MTQPTIDIPAELLPADGRFGCGPSKVRQEAVKTLAEVAPRLLGTSHRRAPVKAQVHRVREGLATFFDLPDGYEVVVANGGATLFWDVAAYNLVRRRSAHAVFGEFSSKFAKVAQLAPFLEEPVVAASEPGSHPVLEPVAGVDAYALTHCETSTGVVMPVVRPAYDALVLVDATSAAGGIVFDPTETDAYYFSPQKSFASDGGLWLALLSPAALDRMEEVAGGQRHVPATLDLRLAVDNARQDQTYNTPAVATLFLMAEQIDWLNGRGGLEAAAKDCVEKSGLIYEWAEARDWACPFVADPVQRSPVVCTVDLDDAIPVDTVTQTLRANGIVDTEGYRKLGRNQLRLATFPAVTRGDVEALIACIDHVVERLA